MPDYPISIRVTYNHPAFGHMKWEKSFEWMYGRYFFYGYNSTSYTAGKITFPAYYYEVQWIPNQVLEIRFSAGINYLGKSYRTISYPNVPSTHDPQAILIKAIQSLVDQAFDQILHWDIRPLFKWARD